MGASLNMFIGEPMRQLTHEILVMLSYDGSTNLEGLSGHTVRGPCGYLCQWSIAWVVSTLSLLTFGCRDSACLSLRRSIFIAFGVEL